MHAKISIILPVKDTEKYLKTCLESIVGQTYKHWELLAVDDASSDSCYSILKEFAKKDDRINVLKNPNPGLLRALRLGYAHSSGELIHRMDSDDVMPNSKLELMITAFNNFRQQENYHLLITGATKYFSDEGKIGQGFLRYDKWLMEVAEQQSYRHEVYKECVIPSNCWLIHRKDFDAIGGFEHDTFPEDYDLCFRFIEAGYRIVGLPRVLHYWRDRSDRISRNWEEYSDNRFFELKVHYFYKMDRDKTRPLILWGGGKNGKDLAKLLLEKESVFNWVCDNDNKIGKDIYGIKMEHFSIVKKQLNPQIIIAVASPDGQIEIENELKKQKFTKGLDYWFFS